jgi:hypothetical protein
MTVAFRSSPWLSPKEMAVYLGVSEDCLQAWRSARKGPAWSKSGKIVRYHIDDADNHLKACRQQPLRKEHAA